MFYADVQHRKPTEFKRLTGVVPAACPSCAVKNISYDHMHYRTDIGHRVE